MPFFIFSFAKFYSFRNFMQTTERKNFGNLRNLKNLKNLKNYGSLTLRTIEKRWQFHGKTIALTFLCLKKCLKYLESA